MTDRLAALNDAKSDPGGPEKQARFRIRDAQRLVLDRGLVAEWGSVLDAQSRRVDVARQKLVGPHPNYWAYLTELASVTEFVRTVVDQVGMDGFNRVWTSPNTLPTKAEIAKPADWIARVHRKAEP